MGDRINPKITGACVIGFALVAGAYIITNFGEPRIQRQPATVAEATTPAQRVAIVVEDKDQNGIEDWRDTFVSTEIISNETNLDTYTPPDTLTGQIGIEFMEGVINSRLYAPFAATEEEVVTRTADSLDKVAELKLFEITDIDILTSWDDQDIINYANTLAATLVRNSVPGLDNEVQIMQEILQNNTPERISELVTLAEVYKNYRDDSLKIPVPETLTKAHLDLINTYQGIYEDISGMTKAFEDPAIAMVHLQRYSDDAAGLRVALNNMYTELAVHGELFTAEDPAILFVQFGADYQPNN